MGGRRFWRSCTTVLGVTAALGVSVAAGRAEPERLYSFPANIGQVGPQGSLAQAPDGTIYAATFGLGPNQRGAVFSFTPPAMPGGSWALGLVHSFSNTDPAGGLYPRAGVTLGPSGELYGTTVQGGGNNGGVLFRLTPPAVPGDAWTKDILHNFGFSEASLPTTDLLLQSDGALYGVTEGGGPSNCGVAYRLRPKANGGLPWVFQVLTRFTPAAGCTPRSKLTSDAAGNLYGTLFSNGPANLGSVYRLNRVGPANYTFERLRAFTDPTRAGNPIGGVALDATGGLIGAARNGGAYGCGAVFRLTPPGAGETRWRYSDIVVLGRTARRACSPVGVAQTADGVLIVPTYSGGVLDRGALLRITAAPTGPSLYRIRLHDSFGPTYNYPQGTPIFGSSGEALGSTTDAISIWRSTP